VYVHLRLKELAQKKKNALRHQQPEKDKQYVDFALPWLEKFLRTPMSGTEGHHCWTTTAKEHFTEDELTNSRPVVLKRSEIAYHVMFFNVGVHHLVSEERNLVKYT